uniref:Reverse transcriptase domain-containing protein n=1 Tax=Tanacetum cinerariifolium TaxID=118510 RepID=A0A6L2K8U6_TANCI|nr:reverse transcriptase domain-containing protein [Tanacetum cinerariifolium]
MNVSTSGVSPDVAELKDMVKALLLDKKGQNQSLTPVKVVEESCVTCDGAHSYRNCPATDGNVYCDNIQEFVSQASAAPAYQAPAPQTQGVSKEDFSAYVKANDAVMKNMQTQGQNMQNQLTNLTDLITKFVNSNSASTSSSGTLPSNTIANPKSDLKAITTRSDNNQIEKFYHIFKDMSFEISFADALILMPKFASTLKALIENKEKLSEMAQTPLNEHCSAVLLKKLPENLGDPGKFLIPCDFLGMADCLALADLGVSINLMPFSVWQRLSLPDLTPTCMTLELADHSISRLVGVAEDVYIKTGRALINVFEGELTLRVGKEAITFNLDQTLSDFLLEKVDAFLVVEDEPTSSEFHQPYLYLEGDILLLEAFLNNDPSLPLPNQRNYLPEVHQELKSSEVFFIPFS